MTTPVKPFPLLPLQPTNMNTISSPSSHATSGLNSSTSTSTTAITTTTTNPGFPSGIPAPISKLPRLFASPAKPTTMTTMMMNGAGDELDKPKTMDILKITHMGKENGNGSGTEDQEGLGRVVGPGHEPTELGITNRKRKGPEDSLESNSTSTTTTTSTSANQPSTSNKRIVIRPGGLNSTTSRPGSSTGFVPTSRASSSTTNTTTAGRRPLSASTSMSTSRPGSALGRTTTTTAGSSSSTIPGARRQLNMSTTTTAGTTSTNSTAGTLNRTRTASTSNLRAGSTVPSSGVRRVGPGSTGTTGMRSTTTGGLGRSTMGLRGTAGGMQQQLSSSSSSQNNQEGRIGEVELVLKNMHEMMVQERANIAKINSSQEEMQALINAAKREEKEARSNLSTAGQEIAELKTKHREEIDEFQSQLSRRDRERRDLEDDLKGCRAELEAANGHVRDVKAALNAQAMSQITMTAEVGTLRGANEALKQELEQRRLAMLEMKELVDKADERVKEIQEELRTAETIRRKLHNQVQELKGNIRVFARVRPAIGSELAAAGDGEVVLAEIEYAQKGQLTSSGQQQLTIAKSRDSAIGSMRKETVPFSFDKVFQPNDGQQEVFEEISMLAQSVLDGYNVCIFAYGQTGSGKSWTMEGGDTAETAGMIPRAIHMIFSETEALQDRGWRYQMYGQFVEIYNEKINNLFGTANDRTEHKVEHDEKKGITNVTGISPIRLETPDQVHSLLARASNLRSVAATNMNERSSRSHSVFSLKVKGENPLTGESCEGVLNLVDLAGSERLDKAGTADHKDRMKETININKSLSSLQNVIQKLSEKSTNDKAHVGYRDSTLTNLLMYSLSGHSKTLMFCNLSPMAAHTNETLNSLRFATKVNSTTIGTAKRQARSS